MSQNTRNITLSMVIAEIEEVLEDYPKQPYQAAFSEPELRQKLIDRVVSHIPSCYSEFALTSSSPESTGGLRCSLEERVRMGNLIRGSIFQVLRENADLVTHDLKQKHTPPAQQQRSADEPSHWFG